MKGARPLTKDEIIAVANQFDGTYAIRNRALFLLGVSVGGRISELLALTIGDVWQNDQPVADLLFRKSTVKGKETARMVPVNEDGRKAIAELVDWHMETFGVLDPDRPLFPSRKFGAALSRSQAHRVLEQAFSKAGLNGKLATHTLRKSYAQRLYDASGDIFLVKELLGHQSVETTKQYLGVSYAKAQAASKAIELNRSMISLHSLQDASTEELLAELSKRGIDLTLVAHKKQAARQPASGKVVSIGFARAG